MNQSYLSSCRLCPRACGVNRLAGETGFCRAGALPTIALASRHHWEEPCISGTRGAGTVFFSHCNLHCRFCQNYRISQGDAGREVTPAELALIFLQLMQDGAHNIDLVTPAHYAPPVAEAVALAKNQGLSIPVVYNTNAYENPETVDLVAPIVDVFLPDLKYYDNRHALECSQAPDYFRHASTAIEKMVDAAGEPVFDDEGLMIKGVIIRHLPLPGRGVDSKRILRWIWQQFGHSVYLSLMNQYTPLYQAKDTPDLGLDRPLYRREYDRLVDYALSLGFENGFIQEGGAASDHFVPDFNGDGTHVRT